MNVTAAAPKAPTVAAVTAQLLDINAQLQRVDSVLETTEIRQGFGNQLGATVLPLAQAVLDARRAFDLVATPSARATAASKSLDAGSVDVAVTAGQLGSLSSTAYWPAGRLGTFLDGALKATRDAADLLVKQST